jgi:glycosyltransferase involved in cell wall biosynthesis
MISSKKIKVAFVHDDFIQVGGAEKLFLEIVKEFNIDESFDVKVYSSLISKNWKEVFKKYNIKYEESFLSYLPFCYKLHKILFIFDWFYLAFSSFDFSEYRVVISSSTRYGHFLITKPDTFHISYINSPPRALWDEKKYFFKKRFLHFLVKGSLPSKRIYDYYSHNYADLIVTNSKNIQRKFLKNYHRNSIIIYPFHSLQNIQVNESKSDYFLIISRLVSWKRLDYVIRTFNSLNLKLIVIGEGSEKEYYQSISSKNITFTGFVSEEEKERFLRNAKAFIFPQIEDFGITLLESLSFNCPVIYLNKGGAKEILNSKVGVPFVEQDELYLKEAIQKLENFNFDLEEKEKILRNFSKNNSIPFLKRLACKSLNYQQI